MWVHCCCPDIGIAWLMIYSSQDSRRYLRVAIGSMALDVGTIRQFFQSANAFMRKRQISCIGGTLLLRSIAVSTRMIVLSDTIQSGVGQNLLEDSPSIKGSRSPSKSTHIYAAIRITFSTTWSTFVVYYSRIPRRLKTFVSRFGMGMHMGEFSNRTVNLGKRLET